VDQACFGHDADADAAWMAVRTNTMLRPAEYESAHAGLFSVDRVTGWEKTGRDGYEEYVPL